MRLLRVWTMCGVFLLWAGAAAAEQAVTTEPAMCIDESAKAALEACPEGATRSRVREQGNAPKSRLHEAKPTKSEGEGGATQPGLRIDMSTRMGREHVRARAEALLTKEIRILNRLVGNTDREDRRRPEILLRLAETQFEMQFAQNAKVRSFDEPIWEACTRDGNKALCDQQRKGQRQAQKELDETREATIRTYATLVRDHPTFKHMDQVLFSLAFGLDELKRFDQSRKVYHRLIKDFPRSRYIPNAYLSFAEFYFAEGDMNAAGKFYRRVIQYPPKRNSVYGYALYKIAWVEYNRERYKDSLKAFVKVMEFARNNPQATDARNLAKQARRELVLPYSRVGSPSKALSFFRRYAKNSDEAYEMLESLAELYYDTGQWPQTITVYHKLMADRPKEDKLCAWQTNVTNAVVSSKSKADQIVELKRQIDIYRKFKKENRKLLNECKTETATMLLWLGTSWHREAVGTPKQPGTRDRTTMGQAGVLYRTLLKDFPDMEQMEFPTIKKEDWPTAYTITYFLAELMWKMEDWAQCGPAFDGVVDLDPQGKYTSDAAYAAVLCYNNLYKQQYRSRERTTFIGKGNKAPEKAKFAKREFNKLEQGMLNAFSRYVCYVDSSEDLARIKYRRARIYYEANRFDEAALLFKDIAFNHKDSELAEYAANLYLDCLNVLGTEVEQPRTACVEELGASIDPMAATFCGNADAVEEHPDLCGVLDTLQCQTRRKQAEVYEKTKQFKQAAITYVRIFNKHRECGEMDEVLYNAAINFEAANLVGRAIQVRSELIRRFPQSHQAKRAVYLVGANYHALAFYEQAAKFYEEFAEKYPSEDGSKCTKEEKEAGTCTKSTEALENAVFFRLGLADDKKAEADAKLFARNYRRKLPRKTAQVVFSIGWIYEQQGRWKDLAAHYTRFLRDYRRAMLPNQEIMANVAIARAYWRMNKQGEARRYYNAAVKAWKAGAARKISALRDVSEEEGMLYLREALDGAAEAQFYLSEFLFQDFGKLKFPAYRGGKSMASVNKWAKGPFKQWVLKKQSALRKAEDEYNEIAKMNVKLSGGVKMESAPWQIAGASRVGEMYRSFVDEFRDAPIPREIERDDELYNIYAGALDEQSEPFKKQAISRFEFCLKTATNVRWFNKWSRTCEDELNQLDARKYPVAAELRGDASYVKDTVGAPHSVDLEISSASELATGGDS